MDALWTTLVNWLHGLGLHAGTGVVNEVGGQVAEGVSAAASQLDMPSLLALAAALGWVSGFRLYAVVFLVGALITAMLDEHARVRQRVEQVRRQCAGTTTTRSADTAAGVAS